MTYKFLDSFDDSDKENFKDSGFKVNVKKKVFLFGPWNIVKCWRFLLLCDYKKFYRYLFHGENMKKF